MEDIGIWEELEWEEECKEMEILLDRDHSNNWVMEERMADIHNKWTKITRCLEEDQVIIINEVRIMEVDLEQDQLKHHIIKDTINNMIMK